MLQGSVVLGGTLATTTPPAMTGPAHDPLDDLDLAMLRAWLLHQPDDRPVSVYTARRLLATVEAERGLAAEDAA